MPPEAPQRRFGHVGAWVRLKLPPSTEPIMLMGNLRPPLSPPLAIMRPEPVSTDPRKRIYVFEAPWRSGMVRLKWDDDYADVLEAEYRIEARRVLPAEEVRAFWGEVKRHTQELGPLQVEAVDPSP